MAARRVSLAATYQSQMNDEVEGDEPVVSANEC
jgi:hypothetical protein